MSRRYPMLSDKTLLIVAENFGLNFSGGSRATAMVAEYFEEIFDQVKVLCLKKGKHNLKHPVLISYEHTSQLPQLIQSHSNEKTIGMGDFHIAHPLAQSSIPYFFVYHDNYPEMKNFSNLSEEMDNEVIYTYGNIFSNAIQVFSVTAYKLDFIKKYTERVEVVRNGLSQSITKKNQKPLKKGNLRILMAGNIDHRKYAKAVEVFEELKEINSKGIQIDIFGHVHDEDLKNQIMEFDFVQYKGFVDEVSYDEYDLYLNTSLIENLSLSVVDSIANKTPVVSFAVGGIKEIINEKNGRVIEAFDTKSMALILQKIKKEDIFFQIDETELEQFDWKKSSIKMMTIINERLHSYKSKFNHSPI